MRSNRVVKARGVSARVVVRPDVSDEGWAEALYSVRDDENYGRRMAARREIERRREEKALRQQIHDVFSES